MSHSYQTRTFTIPAVHVPAGFSSKEDVTSFLGSASSSISDGPGRRQVWGDTRSGWAIYTTRNLLRDHPEYAVLSFLADSGHTYRFEDDYGYTTVSVLDGQTLDRACEALERLISRLQEKPMLVYDADEAGCFCEGDVEAALAREYTCTTPSLDKQVEGDEGMGADYLFTFLRSVLAVLKTARADKEAAVHVLQV